MTSPILWEVLSVTFDFVPPAFCINHPFCISTDVERAFLPRGGQRAQEWGLIGCTWVHPLLPAVAHSRGWAELWLGCPGLLQKTWLELPSCYGFTSMELKCLSLMRAWWLSLWEWCAMWVLPGVCNPPKGIWAPENSYVVLMPQGPVLFLGSAYPKNKFIYDCCLWYSILCCHVLFTSS